MGRLREGAIEPPLLSRCHRAAVRDSLPVFECRVPSSGPRGKAKKFLRKEFVDVVDFLSLG